MSNNSRRIIPPLPGSMFTLNVVSDKENLPLSNHNKLQSRKSRPMDTSANVNDSLSSISDTTDHSGNTLNSSCSSQQYRQRLATSVPSLQKNHVTNTRFQSSNRVLRSGETLEIFFCITKNCDNIHRRLCEDIANNVEDSANDLVKWRQVLEEASDTVDSLKVHTMNSEAGGNLIKLCKRAASRFPCCNGSNIQNTSNKKDLLGIWLLYAKVQCKYGSKQAARSIFQHIKNSRLGDQDSCLYIELAKFELLQISSLLNQSEDNNEKASRLERSIEIIQTALARGSKPVDILNEYLSKLRRLKEEKERQSNKKYIRQTALNKIKFRKNPEPSGSHDLRAQNLKLGGQDVSLVHGKPKGKIMKITYETEKLLERGDYIDNPAPIVNSDESTSSRQSLIEEKYCDEMHNRGILLHEKEYHVPKVPKYNRTKILRERVRNESDKIVHEALDNGFTPKSQILEELPKIIRESHIQVIGTENSNSTDQNIINKITDEENDNTGRTAVSIQSTAKRSLSAMDKRRALLSRNIKKIGGGAQRVSPNEENANSPCHESSCGEKRARLNSAEGTPPQIKKADIDYMLHWTPSRPRSNPVGKVNSCRLGPTITENIEGGSTTKGNASFRSNSLSHSDTSVHGSLDCGGKKNECISTHNTARSSSSSSSTSSSSSYHCSDNSSNSKKKAELGAKVHEVLPCIGKILSSTSQSSSQPLSAGFNPNAYFLPLVREENIITINSKPFLKLGVVGKGGSCKVYRALSKDRNIVGIKKVKLAGMTKKAISGYANEIALLKRLSGNPAIIQIHESEIDIQQKAIFLVMELGEVDLNYVLHQQEIQNNGMGLNMNFIRLTWQQMLSAVNCIHEERIIHGDLKPANFLFVKGSLKLIDFGIAKAIQTDDTINIYRENQVGTLNYMSPESIVDTGTGENGVRVKCGRPSDVWSLGCILYQMCYKKTPFAELRMLQKLSAIIDPKHEIKFPDTIDRAAIAAMKSCLHRKPEDRAIIVGDGGLLNEHHFLHFSNCKEQDRIEHVK